MDKPQKVKKSQEGQDLGVSEKIFSEVARGEEVEAVKEIKEIKVVVRKDKVLSLN